jgi:hypothetical protein
MTRDDWVREVAHWAETDFPRYDFDLRAYWYRELPITRGEAESVYYSERAYCCALVRGNNETHRCVLCDRGGMDAMGFGGM